MTRELKLFATLLAAVHWTAAGAFNIGFDPATEPQKAASVYLAPENQLIFKIVFPGGGFQQLERDYSKGGHLRGPGSWSARFQDDGGVRVSADEAPYGPMAFEFTRGRLTSFTYRGKTTAFAYETPRRPPEGVMSPLAVTPEMNETAAREYALNEFLNKWKGTGRLAWPFVNPNHNGILFAQLALLLFFAVVFSASSKVRVFCCVLSVAAWGGLVWTGSRGAWLGVVAGLAPFGLLRVRSWLRSRWFWWGLALIFGAVALFVLLSPARQLTRGFGSWSNAIRLEIARLAPAMMVDAPSGWGWWGAGDAYLHWYQPLHVFALTPTLINDHLTRLVEWGWCGRALYLWAAYALLAFALYVCMRRGQPAPFAFWTSLGVAAAFNPMMHRWWFWLLPVLSCGLLVRAFPWRRWRLAAGLLLGAAFLAGLTLWGVYACGSRPRALSVRSDEPRVLINGTRPFVWVVDDGTLGGGLTGKDVREFYSAVDGLPALGVVRRVADLPADGVVRLVLAGSAGAEWLTRLSEDPSARERLPRQVRFISPDFPPSALPEGVRKLCDPLIVVGEFAALYDREYDHPPPWVKIVPGMEKYLLRWMEFVMGR